MNLIEKLEPVILILAIIVGLILSDIEILSKNSGNLINLFLCIMIYGLFLEVPLKDLKKSFKNIKFTSTSLIINFIWTPLFGYFLGNLFLNGNIDIFIGFFMLILTPCTDWYLVFTKMAKGDLNLSLSILPINLILQLILLPIYLIIFFSSNNTINYIAPVDTTCIGIYANDNYGLNLINNTGIQYFNHGKTKAAFVQNPLNPYYPEIVYKTGDLVTKLVTKIELFAS